MIRVEFVSEVTSDRCTGREISFHRIGSKIGMQDRNHFTIFPSVSVFQNYIIIQKIYFPRNFPSTKYKKED